MSIIVHCRFNKNVLSVAESTYEDEGLSGRNFVDELRPRLAVATGYTGTK